MIDRPGVVVTARPSDTWRFEGVLASRAQVFAHRFMTTVPEAERRPLQVLVERCPPEHSGLGVGTQLGLAVARAVADEVGLGELTAVELAGRIGRGERSAVGIHGFDRGGLIVEPGKLPAEPIAPLLTRLELPEAWRVVVFLPQDAGSWHGDRERDAFREVRSDGLAARTDALCRVVLLGMLPAAVAGDLDAFGEAVHEFNRWAGEPFARSQGGTYAGGGVAELVAAIRAQGVRGVGQSSWGPAVFALVGSEESARGLLRNCDGRARGLIARVSAGVVVERPPVAS
jgi:beta-RFAP synthase